MNHYLCKWVGFHTVWLKEDYLKKIPQDVLDNLAKEGNSVIEPSEITDTQQQPADTQQQPADTVVEEQPPAKNTHLLHPVSDQSETCIRVRGITEEERLRLEWMRDTKLRKREHRERRIEDMIKEVERHKRRKEQNQRQ